MSNLPPMSGRAFRDYFMIEDRYGDGGNLNVPAEETRFEDDPYERCDFEEED